MLRQLLTLLAVLTGLTTAVAPAQALNAGVQAVAVAQDAAATPAQAEVAFLAEKAARQRLAAPLAERAAQGPAFQYAPAVVLKADRAHE
ncbi:hypothetical protein [Altererythrobacter lauratis]|uniref:DUF4148 domain-containing protein n=1 Tax=Alteraurantiacibacter lauratis TaxID=2054627 RepID=A0ABV7ECQ4_9SPHN